MRPEHQAELVTNLCDSIRDSVLKRIEECKIPEDWDGLELRQLLAEMFWRERGFNHTAIAKHQGRYHHPSSQRVRNYRNLVLTENLDR